MTAPARTALERARARLDRLPWFARFDGYATHRLILLRHPVWAGEQDDLITHELCHVWQMQHHPLRMPLSYLVRGYHRNPYELEARRVAGSWPAQASTGNGG